MYRETCENLSRSPIFTLVSDCIRPCIGASESESALNARQAEVTRGEHEVARARDELALATSRAQFQVPCARQMKVIVLRHL